MFDPELARIEGARGHRYRSHPKKCRGSYLSAVADTLTRVENDGVVVIHHLPRRPFLWVNQRRVEVGVQHRQLGRIARTEKRVVIGVVLKNLKLGVVTLLPPDIAVVLVICRAELPPLKTTGVRS